LQSKYEKPRSSPLLRRTSSRKATTRR
jgi:hypothetical protein